MPEDGQIDPPPVVFQKMYLLKRGWNPGFFGTVNIILKHIFPENFIEFPEVVQKIWRNLEFLTLHCYKETNDISL